MASGSLKFVVEVNADQATQGFRAISSGLDDLGIKSKVSFLKVAEGGRGAGAEVISFEQKVKSLKGEMASGDRTVNFFARSLNNIVPEASAAGQGIRLLADGLIGGVGLGFALQGVLAILTLFGEKLRETSEAERKAAEDSKRYADERLKAWVEADRKWRELKFIQAGGTKEGFAAQEANASSGSAVKKAQDALAAAQEQFRRNWAGTVPDEGTLHWKQYQEELETIRKLAADVARELDTAAKTAGVGLATMESAVKEAKAAAAGEPEDTGAPVFAPFQGFQFGPGGDNAVAPDMEAVSAGMGHPLLGTATYDLAGANEQFSKGFIKKEKDDDKDRRERVQEAMQQMQEMKALADPIAQAFGQTFAAIGSGAKSMAEIWKTAAQQIMQVVYQLAVKSIMSHAAGAAAGAAESQAAEPIVGPSLAIAAMGAMMAAVTGLLGSLPSAAGGWSVPADTLAFVHKDEKILPARYSAGLDRLVSGGGVGSTQITIAAMDGASVQRTVSSPEFGRALRKSQRQARRRGQA